MSLSKEPKDLSSCSFQLVLASGNQHKVREFERLLPLSYRLKSLPEGIDLPPETGTTFAENALIKAKAVASLLGVVVIADDSGIESEELNGAPGVRSARYAGEHASDAENLAKLRLEVKPGSGLRYVCALAYIDPANQTGQLFEGYCKGRMAQDPQGERGFGYDPIFLPNESDSGLTMAQLSDQEKDRLSHRGKALRQLVEWLERRHPVEPNRLVS